MRYQPLSRRLINLIYPLVIYMAIGMAVLGLYPNGGLILYYNYGNFIL